MQCVLFFFFLLCFYGYKRIIDLNYDNLDLFRAIASSTALNCFNNSSRRFVFFEELLLDSDFDAAKIKQNWNSSIQSQLQFVISQSINYLPEGFAAEEELFFFSRAVLSWRLLEEVLRLVVDPSDDPLPDDSESDPLESDESELELDRFSCLRDPATAEWPFAEPERRESTAGGGELGFLRFNAFVANGFPRFSIENEMGLARFSGGGGGARLSTDGRRAVNNMNRND